MPSEEVISLNIRQEAEDFLKAEITKASHSESRLALDRFLMAALGSVPWIGSFLSAAVSFGADKDAIRTNSLYTQWLEEHATKLAKLRMCVETIMNRFENLGTTIDERIQSEEYLRLVRRAFRIWDDAATDEKRQYVGNVLANAAGTRLCSDDVVRLFLDWLNIYHEAHFAVIRTVYAKKGITRFEIWDQIYGELPREDAAEADLYRLLIRDLSTGGVIRQDRETNYAGQFLRKRRPKARQPDPGTLESAFEDTKPYVLTGLGEQFVHYTMNEIVKRVGSGDGAAGTHGGNSNERLVRGWSARDRERPPRSGEPQPGRRRSAGMDLRPSAPLRGPVGNDR